MADVKISALPAAGALSGTEDVAVVQSGNTVKTTAQSIANLTSLASGASLFLDRQASNATGTVAFPTNFLPAAGATYTMGGLSLSWRTGTFDAILKSNGATLYDIQNNRLNDSSGNPAVYVDAKQLRTGTHGAPVTKFDWATIPTLYNAAGSTMLVSGSSTLSFSMDFLPGSVSSLNIGSQSLPVQNLFSTSSNCTSYDVRTTAFTGENGQLTGTPLEQHSGVTTLVTLKTIGSTPLSRPLGIFTENNSTADANPTDGIYIGTGNKTAGTGRSGDVTVKTGTSAGGTPGDINLNPQFVIFTNGNPIIKSAAVTSGTAADMSIVGGEATSGNAGFGNLTGGSATTGVAGDAVIRGGSITGAGGTPGWGVVYGGDSNQADVQAGSVLLSAGDNSSTGTGGDVDLRPGDGTVKGRVYVRRRIVFEEAQADLSYDFQTPTTGFSYTVDSVVGMVILDPAGTLATGTITMPASPFDGQVVRISCSQIITALTVSANSGQSIKNAPTTIAAGGSFAYIYYATGGANTWYKYS